jgi:hypothetical protein
LTDLETEVKIRQNSYLSSMLKRNKGRTWDNLGLVEDVTVEVTRTS